MADEIKKDEVKKVEPAKNIGPLTTTPTPTPTQSTFTKGFGSYISWAATSNGAVSGSYTKIGQTVDLGSPESEVGNINVTNNDSPNNSKEYAPGLYDPGTLDFEVIYEKSVFASIKTMEGDGNIYGFQETFPADSAAGAGATCTFLGFWKKASVEGKTEDEALKGKISIQLVSKETWA